MLRYATTVLVTAIFWSTFAMAASDDTSPVKRDVYDLPTPVAIQGRTNSIDQSLAFSAGYILSDSFNRGFPLTVGYSFYFTSYLAWEVASYSYNINSETKVKQDLRNSGVDTSTIGIGGQLDFPKNIITTGIVYTPFYGKSLLFNKTLVHSETSFFLGAGSISFNQTSSAPTIAPGIQGRYFLSKQSALRYYLRQYFYKDPVQGFGGITELGVGYEFQLNLFSKNTSSDEDE